MVKDKSCVVYHGLGSRPAISREQLLNKAGYIVLSEQFDYDAEWDLDQCKSLFFNELNKIKKVNLIIGISFGGHLAYNLSKATGIDVLLINPALNREASKSVIKEFDIPKYDEQSNIEIFFGEGDVSVPMEYTRDFLEKKGENYRFHIVKDMAHRIPDNYFKHIVNNSLLIDYDQPDYNKYAKGYDVEEEREKYFKWCWENRDKISQMNLKKKLSNEG